MIHCLYDRISNVNDLQSTKLKQNSLLLEFGAIKNAKKTTHIRWLWLQN